MWRKATARVLPWHSFRSWIEAMRRAPRDYKCSYVVVLNRTDDLRELARYLSTVGLDCEVVILDPSPRFLFATNARTLRWVGRHLHMPGGPSDLTRAATAVASCEKVIVAADDIRYTPDAITRMCALLELHDVVEPQDYLDPLPWWSGLDAGRILIHRGIEPQPDHGETFAFRRNPRHARSDTYPAADLFVRRAPRTFSEWLALRPKLAGDDFALPVKTAFFMSLIPLLILFAVSGGLQLATGYAGTIAFTSIALAVRGRLGAAPFFPLRTCLFAPLWVLERSVSVYWALFRKLSGGEGEPPHTAAPDRAGQRVASGE
ncbi:MAG: hypothetical protein DMF56_10955 [Acidobacteria bacterium]|nr:MAG: hypothetical protein DMF56_10955 [Acidobacteriota bacterium]